MNDFILSVRNLINKADDILAAIDGSTDQFEQEAAELSTAISQTEKALLTSTQGPVSDAASEMLAILKAFVYHADRSPHAAIGPLIEHGMVTGKTRDVIAKATKNK